MDRLDGAFFRPTFFLFILINLMSDRRGSLLLGIGLALAGLLLVFWQIFIPSLPKPSGVHRVASTSFALSVEGESSPVTIQIWYPAQVSTLSGRAHYDSPRQGQVRWINFAMRLANLHAASAGEPVVTDNNKPLAVIFYEHGLGGHRLENFALCAELASHGALVVAIDHAVSDSNGTGVIRPHADFTTAEAASKTFHDLNRLIADRAARLDRVAVTLAAQSEMNNDSTLAALSQLANWQRCDIFGFSIGGAVALNAAARIPRFYRAANLDGLLFCCSTESPKCEFEHLSVAPLFLDQKMPVFLERKALPATPCPGHTLEETIIASEREIRNIIARTGAQRIVFDQARHEDFTDAPFVDPLGFLRSPARSSIHRRLCESLLAYFGT